MDAQGLTRLRTAQGSSEPSVSPTERGAGGVPGAVRASLELSQIQKRYGSVDALAGVDLSVRSGELLTILGPSGSGKTTLLKVIAGFEIPEHGTVRLGGEDVTLLSPAKREIGMVFQNYALFPHMSVRENVAFPLECRRLRRAEIERRVAEALDLVELGGYGDRLPRQLSGGQQQRVALARAIVFRPRLLLLDEPFGALDRKLREAMQLEVRRLQRRIRLTTVFITHDQEEALILSDRIAVMRQGLIEQIASPLEIYERPANAFVAEFIGESNILAGAVAAAGSGTLTVALENGLRLVAAGEMPPGTRVGAMIRPERLVPAGKASDRENVFRGEVREITYVGASHKYQLRLDGGTEMLVRLPAGRVTVLPGMGERFAVSLAPEDIHLLPLA